MLFTNLQFHSYYQTANALLALCAVGLGIATIYERGQPLLAEILLAVLVLAQFAYFQTAYAPVVAADTTRDPSYLIALAAKRSIPADQSLLIFGQGWSSLVPYYSERKSLAVPFFIPTPTVRRILGNPNEFMGDTRLGAVVYCTVSEDYAKLAPLIDSFVAGRRTAC